MKREFNMKEVFQLIKDIPKMIGSSNGLESMMGMIVLCLVTPIVLLIGLVLYKLVEYLIY